MKQIVRVPHLWIILAIMAFGAVVYYSDQIPVVQNIISQAPFKLARYSTHRILSIIPVVYAAMVFRFWGGTITAIFISLVLLPRALFISQYIPEALAETIAFLFIGLLVTWLIHRQQRVVYRLEKARQEVSESLQIVKHHEQQLQLSEERYRSLFENASEAILICSPDGQIISVNRACEQLTGYTQDELSAVKIYELFSGMSLEIVQQVISDKLESTTLGEVDELSLAKKNGQEAFIQLKVNPLLTDNQVIALQAIARDITEERRLRKNMQYYITQITRVQEDERLRISRELHDDTAQVLTSLARGLDLLISKQKELRKPVIEQLEKLRKMADSALEGVRRFSQDLRPSILDDLGLIPALEWLVADLEKQLVIKTKVSITGNHHRLPMEKELTIFRISQEALNNVKRHSQASSVEMVVDFGYDAVTLVISDDGRGFTMPQRASDLIPSGRLGLVGMRERARLVGGTLIVQSEIGVGTIVTLRVSE